MTTEEKLEKTKFRPDLPVDLELVTIFTEFIINLDYSFWDVNRFYFIYTECE